MGNAGRVLMIPKGEYNSATTYEMLDFVYYQGRSYVCKQTSTGNAPTNTTYWQVMTPDSSAEIQALTNEVRGNWATGGVNKLPNTGTTDTKNGVTATYASDGKVTLNASSASTNISDFPISSTSKPFYLKEGTYVLSGGASADARLYIRTVASSSAIAIDSGNGAEFTVTSEMASGGFAVYLNVASGKTFNDVVISPMVADADYSGGYLPYAMTNRELTARTTFSLTSDDSEYIPTNNPLVFEKVGKVVCVRIKPLKNNVPQGQNIKLGTIPVEYRPYIEPSFRFIIPNNSLMALTIASNGDVLLYNYNVTVGDGTSVINSNETLTYIAN